MKKCIPWLVCALWIGTPILAGPVPQMINFQGRLDDGTGQTVPDGVYTVTFRMFDSPQVGNLLWEETQNVNTTDGLFAVLMGSIQPIPDSVFRADSCYLEIEPAGSGPVLPRVRLTSVAYARRAGAADLLGSSTEQDLEESAEITSAIASHASNPSAHHNKTLSADELVTGTLSEARLPQKAIDSTEIEDASITDKQIENEPGIAHSFTSLTPLGDQLRVVDSSMIYAPTFGYVYIIVSGYFYVYQVAGGQVSALLTVSSSRTTHEYEYAARFDVYPGAPEGHTTESFAIQRVETVTRGTVKFFLLGERLNGPEFPNVQDVQINTMFFPTSYGEIDATVPPQQPDARQREWFINGRREP